MSSFLPSTSSILLTGPGLGGGQPEKEVQALAEKFVQGKFRNIGREDREEEGVSVPEVRAAIGPS